MSVLRLDGYDRASICDIRPLTGRPVWLEYRRFTSSIGGGGARGAFDGAPPHGAAGLLGCQRLSCQRLRDYRVDLGGVEDALGMIDQPSAIARARAARYWSGVPS
jgi:hypothetical protein